MFSDISILPDPIASRSVRDMSKDLDKEPKDRRVQFLTTASQVQRIDDWMHERRIRSQGDAIRQLIDIALGATERKLD